MQTWLVDIPLEDCEGRLAASALGRIGVIVDGRPEIFPVNHVYDASTHTIAFPTNDRTKLHAALSWPWVAFEVDGVEPDGATGWSVLVVGRAEEITDVDEVARIAAQRSAPWAGGATARWVRIVPTETTGRRISAVVGRSSGQSSEAGTPPGATGSRSTGMADAPSTSRTTAA